MCRWLRLTVQVSLLAGVPAICAAQITPAAGYTPPDDTQSIKLGAVIFY